MNFVSVGQNLANYFLHRRFQSMIEPTMFWAINLFKNLKTRKRMSILMRGTREISTHKFTLKPIHWLQHVKTLWGKKVYGLIARYTKFTIHVCIRPLQRRFKLR
jgi:hypothetical protein